MKDIMNFIIHYVQRDNKIRRVRYNRAFNISYSKADLNQFINNEDEVVNESHEEYQELL